jgi:hypothetical protein
MGAEGRMNRTERHRRAFEALLAFARTEPVTYDELADRGELNERLVRDVDDQLSEGAA